MFKKNGIHRVTSLGITLMMLISLFTMQVFASASEEDENVIYVISGSDFQHPNGGSYNADIVREIMGAMKADGVENPYGFLFAGDYGHTESDAKPLQYVVNDTFPELAHKVYIQGNHDDLMVTYTIKDEPIAESGNHDPEDGEGPYGVFVVNNQDYIASYTPDATYDTLAKSLEEVQERTEAIAAKLEKYLNEKIKDNFTKPIFVVSHLPLHVTARTYQGMSNEEAAKSYANEDRPETTGLYAKALVDVLNAAGEKGLNIIFLYGHNHGWGFDSVVGGDCTYLARGEEIRYASGGTFEDVNVESATLNFTYMNAGYTGYYQYDSLDKSVAANDGALTMTLFKITEDTVEVCRYNQQGRNALARVPYNTIFPQDDATLGYTGLLTLEEAGGTLDNITTVKAKVGEEGAVITLNKDIDSGMFPVVYLVGSVVGLVLILVVVTVSGRCRKTAKKEKRHEKI